MLTHASQRWANLLAMPLVALGVVLPLTTATATNVYIPSVKVHPAIQPALVAQRSRVQRVRFAPGANSATVKSSVVNGTRDRYLLGAQKGQTMSIRIVSLEDNAVFDVVAPSNDGSPRRTLKQEVMTWNNVLPATGDYQIVVGSTRGNASYRLQVTIR